MKIVIDINEEDYEIMKHNVAVDNPLCPLGEREMVTAVASGTPLPKGHGDLIDRNELKKVINQFECYDQVLDAPAIVKADKGE